MYRYNLGLCPEELCGIGVCRPDHKNGIQAYLAVDATPKRGGIVFYTNTGIMDCFYYQPDFNELGIEIDPSKPTTFEMVNLLIALFIFKKEILNHKTVRIIVDNNNVRKKGKIQRNGLTEAIGAILEWCDDYGCTINELFQSNMPNDKPYLRVADKLSRNMKMDELMQWLSQWDESDQSWGFVIHASYKEILPMRKAEISQYLVALMNGLLPELHDLSNYVPESYYCPDECGRFQRMFEDETSESLCRHIPDVYEPKESWVTSKIVCLVILITGVYFWFKKIK